MLRVYWNLNNFVVYYVFADVPLVEKTLNFQKLSDL